MGRGAAQNVPLRGTEAGCLSSAFRIALEGVTPGSLRLYMSPQLGATFRAFRAGRRDTGRSLTMFDLLS